jgi:hypothetical protein
LQIAPRAFDSSHPKSLARGGRETGVTRPCSGEEGHRRRGPRGGKVSGAHGGLIGPCVKGRGDWKGGPRREPEAAAEGSTTMAMLRRSTSVKVLHISSSELWGRYWCSQLET